MRLLLLLSLLFNMALEAYAQSKTPKMVVNLGHTEPIESLQLSHQEKYVLSCSKTETKLWDFKTGRLIRMLKQKGEVIINPEETLYACDGKIYDLKKDSLVLTLNKTESNNEDKAIDFGSKYVVFESGVYEVQSGKLMKKWPIGELSEDGLYIFNNTQLFDISNQKSIQKYADGFPNKIFDPINLCYEELKTGNLDQNIADTLVIYDCKSNKILKQILYLPIKGHVNSLSTLSFNGQYVATGSGFQYGLSRTNSRDTTIKLYDYSSGLYLRTLPGHVLGVSALEFSRDHKYLISAGKDRVVRIWDVATGALIMKLGGLTTGVNQVCFSEDGSKIASAGDAPRVWNVKLGNLTQVFKGHTDVVTGVCFLKKDSALVSCSFDKTIKTWDFSTGRVKKNMRGHTNRIFSISMAEDGESIVSVSATGAVADRLGIDKTSWDKKQSFKKWNLNTGRQHLSAYASHSSAISPDGKHMVCYRTGYSQTEEEMADGSVSRIVVLDYITGKKEAEIKINNTFVDYDNFDPTFRFFKDSKNILIGYGNRLLIFDIDTGWFALQLPENIVARTIAMNHTETIVAIGTTASDIVLYDLINKKVMATLSGHQSDVLSLDFSPDDKRLVSGSLDTQIKLWDLEKMEEIVSFIALNGGEEYITYSPDGYYMSSKGATQAIHFILDDEVFLFDQFDLKYNRPDTILQRLSANESQLIKLYKEAYYKRLKKSGLKVSDLNTDFEIPEVESVAFGINPLNSKIHYQLKARHPYDGLIQKLYVWVNDVPYYGSNGILLNPDVKNLYYEDSIKLSNGLNKLQFSVLDNHGTESLKQTFYFNNSQTAERYNINLVAISVSQYADENYRLKYAVKDGRDFSGLFAQTFESIKMDTLFDKKAVKENIQSLRKKLLNTSVNDILIFYISGHGLLDNSQDFFYATQNIDFDKPALQGFSYEAIDQLMDSIPCRKKLLLIDACHSGEVDKEMLKDEAVLDLKTELKEEKVNIVFAPKGVKMANRGAVVAKGYSSFELMQELFSNINRGNGSIVLSASAGNSFAFESDEWRNGIFTYCILKGLKENAADENGDGMITVNELKSYVSAKVWEMTKGRQKPTSRQQNLEFDWEIWR